MFASKRQLALISLILCFVTSFALADVTKKSTTKMDFKGTLGTIMKLFGGERPVNSVEYLKGNLFRTDMLDKKGKPDNSTIIDLDNETITTVDHGKKQYTTMTFDEYKEMMEKALQGLTQSGSENKETSGKPETEIKWSFDINVSKPGESKDIAGYATDKAILELNVEAEATQKPENGGEAEKAKGGLKVKSDNWMAKTIAEQDEMIEFSKKLAEKFGFVPGAGNFKSVISSVMQNNPQLGAAMEKMQEESAKLEGMPLEVHTIFETWGERPQAQKQEEETEIPTSIGGLMKSFGKKNKKDENPNVLLETTMIIEQYNNSPLSDDIFAIPSNYKEKKKK